MIRSLPQKKFQESGNEQCQMLQRDEEGARLESRLQGVEDSKTSVSISGKRVEESVKESVAVDRKECQVKGRVLAHPFFFFLFPFSFPLPSLPPFFLLALLLYQ